MLRCSSQMYRDNPQAQRCLWEKCADWALTPSCWLHHAAVWLCLMAGGRRQGHDLMWVSQGISANQNIPLSFEEISAIMLIWQNMLVEEMRELIIPADRCGSTVHQRNEKLVHVFFPNWLMLCSSMEVHSHQENKLIKRKLGTIKFHRHFIIIIRGIKIKDALSCAWLISLRCCILEWCHLKILGSLLCKSSPADQFHEAAPEHVRIQRHIYRDLWTSRCGVCIKTPKATLGKWKMVTSLLDLGQSSLERKMTLEHSLI